MCLSPQLVKKPLHLSTNSAYSIINGNSSYTYVPCGTCPSCVALKQSYIIQRCQLESIDNDLWFCSLSYNNESLPIIEVNKRKIKYPLLSDFQKYIKMLRKYNVFGTKFRFLAVSEYGSKPGSHRPHWHIIFSTPKRTDESFAEKLEREHKYFNDCLFYWRRNYGSTRKPLWKPLLTYVYRNGKSTYDFHYVNPFISNNGEDDVGFYVTKYVLKANKYIKNLKSALYFNLDEKEFKRIWSIVKPRFLLSKGFGDIKNSKVIDYVHKCVKTSLDDKHDYFVFINPSTGQEFPLAPYLRKKFLTNSDIYYFYERNGCDNLISPEPLSYQEYIQKLSSGKKRISFADKRDSVDFICDNDDTIYSKYLSPSINVRIINNDDILPDYYFDDVDLPSAFTEDLPPAFFDNFKDALKYG